MHYPILSLINLSPLLGGLYLLLLPSEKKALLRNFAFGISLVPFLLSLPLLLHFNRAESAFQFVEKFPWIPAIGVDYFLGVDGLSLTLVFLTALLMPLALLASFSIEKNVKTYLFLFLLLETGTLGVFLALNFFHFFLFWELGLIPMFFLIKVWGSENRHYAAFKFFVYTLFGSVSMLLAFQLIYLATKSFDFVELAELSRSGLLKAQFYFLSKRLGLPFSPETVMKFAFFAISLGFAIKVPIWPFHTWLPDAHTQAPTAGSMILAGLLLKMGVYGFLRLGLPLFPEVVVVVAPLLAYLALASILFGALAAMAQTDLKRMIAYSSINHMGYCMLGIFAVATAGSLESKASALNGVVLQMFNHGISAAALFFLVGVLYDRTHTRDLSQFGGIRKMMPLFAGVMGISTFSSLGLPGLGGFISEFLIFRGVFPLMTGLTLLATGGLLITAIYLLSMIQRVFHGPPGHHRPSTDMTQRELTIAAPLLFFMFFLGVYPSPFLNITRQAVSHLLELFS